MHKNVVEMLKPLLLTSNEPKRSFRIGPGDVVSAECWRVSQELPTIRETSDSARCDRNEPTAERVGARPNCEDISKPRSRIAGVPYFTNKLHFFAEGVNGSNCLALE